MKIHPDLLLIFIASIPFLTATAMWLREDIKTAGRLIILAIWTQLMLIVWLTLPLFTGSISNICISPDFIITRIDAAFILLTSAVSACALTQSHIYFQREASMSGRSISGNVRLNYACAMFFVLAMYTVFCCKNLGYLWICVESTTLLSAPLVYFSRTKRAIEATWKYLIICSVGISLALLGILFIFAAGQHGAISGGSLQISRLIAVAPQLDFKLLRFGWIFCLLGYGTKAGLFPLHSWLPDAHSEAPAPSSALLSGSLLNCALFAIWRTSQIVEASAHHQLASTITVWIGTATVVAASLFLIRQYALKRLLAYSSIENVGVMLLAIGLNSGWLFFFQALNHSISKVSLFLLSGNIIQATGSKKLSDQSGLMASAPAWAVLLAMSIFAGTGAPPFGTFLSEWLILMKTMELHYYASAACVLIALSLAFIVVSMHIGKIILGAPNPHLDYFRPIATSVIPAALAICSLVLGLTSGAIWNSWQ